MPRTRCLAAVVALLAACGSPEAGGPEQSTTATGASSLATGADPSQPATTTGGDTADATPDTASEPTSAPDSSGEGTASGTDTGTPPNQAACIPAAAIEAMAEPFACEALGPITASLDQLPYDCHTQGIGFHPDSQRFVVTCQDQGAGTQGRILSFARLADARGQWPADGALALFVDADTTHPSAIQIDPAGGLVVAMAKGSASGPASLFSVALHADGSLTSSGAPTLHAPSHLGAMAWAPLDAGVFAVGCGWDCDTFSVYGGPGPDGTLPLLAHGDTASFVLPGVDENVGAYNSLALTQRCEDGQALLLASHDNWLDVWEVSGLVPDAPTVAPTLRKVAKRQISRDVVQWMGRPIFYEGMTLEIQDDAVFFWAAPHDLGTDNCPAATRCAQYVYRCHFGA